MPTIDQGNFRYFYHAQIVRVIDGDTVVADIDLGLRTTRREALRLAHIDAPEVRGEEREQGLASKQHLVDLLGEGAVVLETFKNPQERYGRFLATIFIADTNINDQMVADGYAETSQ